MVSYQHAIVLLVAVLFLAPEVCTSRKSIKQNESPKGFRISLKHVDSDGNFTKFELLKRAMKRGRERLDVLSLMALADSGTDVKSSVYPGNGEFLMKLSIGTPEASFSAIMDTGSDLIWTQCKPCSQCFDQSTPIFDPKKSSSYTTLPCSSKLCSALPTSKCGTDGCEYEYSYGDYSSTQGVMGLEKLTFDNVTVSDIVFGCGEDNEGSGFSQGAGIVGLGRGPLSLVSQLDEPKFSYCLTSIDDTKSSTLLLGSLATIDSVSTKSTTPLIKNPSQPSFYYLSLEGISVGDSPLPIKKSTFALNNDGSGGVIIDSGTTITYLEESAFDMVKKAFIDKVKLQVDNSGSAGLDLCFKLPSGTTDFEVPKLIFHFEGADLDLPGENYIISDSSIGLACLAMGSSSGMSIFGNVQQQNFAVVHDLQKDTLSFVPTQCSKQ